MPDRPRAPASALITWLAVVADAIALVLLFRSNQPLMVKAVAGGLDALGLYTILVFYLGRRWEWRHLSRHFKKVERRGNRVPEIGSSASPTTSRQKPGTEAA